MNNAKARIKKTVKKHIPQKHLSELRIIYRIVMETVYGIKRTGFINFAIIAAMAAILTIFGALFRTTFSLNSFVEKMGDTLEISVYLRPSADVGHISTRIKQLEHVDKVKVITKEDAWNTMRKEMSVADIENPLPDTLHVKVDKPENITSLCTVIKKIPGVEDLNYAQDIAKKLQTFNKVFNTVTILVVIAVALLTVIIINSTIQLVIQSRKEEIEIMRLMGVSNWYIKIPLILQGAVYGFLGAVVSLIPLNTVQNGLTKLHEFLAIPAPEFTINIVIFSLFLIAILCSAGGSMLSIKKHLQV